MPDGTNPHFDTDAIDRARDLRKAAADLMQARGPVETRTNGEKDDLDPPVTAFHKGVPHDVLGRPDAGAYATFKSELTGPQTDGYARFEVPLGPEGETGAYRPGGAVDAPAFSTEIEGGTPSVRNWESPLAGHHHDLQGPDPSGLVMAPAPRLGESELCAELAEVYAMAALRDVNFKKFGHADTPAAGGVTVGEVIAELGGLSWFDPAQTVTDQGTDHEARRRAARGDGVTADTLFRGSTPGAMTGPYVSQFMLIGNPAMGVSSDAKVSQNTMRDSIAHEGLVDGPEDGYIVFGAQRIDQRINAHRAGCDYMTSWPLWLDVQNGADVRGSDVYEADHKPRFIGTPRDLATYVHFDQLYQAYFNACLLLFALKQPFDHGFPSGGAHATRGSFATFGGPHVLSLMTEVASRALKAVRRQKFQCHLRGRPEQLAAMLALEANGLGDELGNGAAGLAAMHDELKRVAPGILGAVAQINETQNLKRRDNPSIYPRTAAPNGVPEVPEGTPDISSHNLLLPMAFPEGSPMHACYGAGHATVAGACVTMLKAFFEMSDASPDRPAGSVDRPLTAEEARQSCWWDPALMSSLDGLAQADAFCASDDRLSLVSSGTPMADLTVQGELDKLAANISIGRNMAGVHFYTDYYDSLRMGERLAVGMLQEQALCYVDPMTMRLPSFDGDRVLISGDGQGSAMVEVQSAPGGSWVDYRDEWWDRHRGF